MSAWWKMKQSKSDTNRGSFSLCLSVSISHAHTQMQKFPHIKIWPSFPLKCRVLILRNWKLNKVGVPAVPHSRSRPTASPSGVVEAWNETAWSALHRGRKDAAGLHSRPHTVRHVISAVHYVFLIGLYIESYSTACSPQFCCEILSISPYISSRAILSSGKKKKKISEIMNTTGRHHRGTGATQAGEHWVMIPPGFCLNQRETRILWELTQRPFLLVFVKCIDPWSMLHHWLTAACFQD